MICVLKINSVSECMKTVNLRAYFYSLEIISMYIVGTCRQQLDKYNALVWQDEDSLHFKK